jgi:two-component system sensor histidine kinase RegB
MPKLHSDAAQAASTSDDFQLLSRLRINISWFLKLRWAAAGGQLVTIFVVHVAMGIELPLVELLSIVSLAIVSNAMLELWLARQDRMSRWKRWASKGELVLGSVMVFDMLLLTALLAVSGGPTNPFAIFYLANISLAAVMLGPRWLWSLSGFAIFCYAGLFVSHRPLPVLGDLHASQPSTSELGADAESLQLLTQGEFVAFTAALSISIYFMTRVTSELARREADLRHARHLRVQSDKLEALSTLAAGAAHELASPLSTIAVIARELELHLETGDHLDDAVDEAKMIRREVDRCRVILDQMAAGAGEATGEELVVLRAGELVEECLSHLREHRRIDVRFEDAAEQVEFLVPRTAMVRAIRSLLKNAIDASDSHKPVALVVSSAEDGVRLTIVDRGEGMTPEVLARAGDPFFTTKDTGSGMGLGIFITRAVVERLGGTLTLQSSPELGTTACVYLPHAREGAARVE